MIIDEINKANLQALKDKDANAKSVLGVIKNKYLLANVEARKNGKELTDNDMILILQKTAKELEEEATSYKNAGRIETFNDIVKQKEIVEKYLPTMMSEDEIRQEILTLADKSIPSVMKHFKANFAGKCDMAKVNAIARTLN